MLRTVAGNDVVLDAYNANPNSMAAALRSFAHRPCAPGQTKLMVLGDMLELGAASRFEHRVVGELLAGLPLPQVLLIGPEVAAGGSISPGVARGHHSRSRRLATPTPRAGPAGAGEGQPRPGAGNAAGDAVAQLSAGAGPAMLAG